jgi:molybdate transport system substrate-binding protein
MRYLLYLLLLLAPLQAHAQSLTVFAAASLTDAFKDISAQWVKEGHQAPRMSFAASSTLAQQIDQGAPVNIFASADEKWMDFLAKKNEIVPGTREDLLGNDLVMVVPSAHPAHLTINADFDILKFLGPTGRLSVGDPAHVPAGIYAEQALRKLGWWDKVSSRLAPAPDVRSALLVVERGETPAGIVYGTDAAVSKSVMVAGTFPADSHEPVTYPFAVTKAGDTQEAREFLKYLSGPEAKEIWVRRGFKVQ